MTSIRTSPVGGVAGAGQIPPEDDVPGQPGGFGGPLTTTTGRPEVDAVRDRRRAWARRAALCDLAAVVLVGLVGVSLMRTLGPETLLFATGVVAGLVALLGTSYAVVRCWHPVLVASGGEEYTRLLRAGTWALLAMCLVVIAFDVRGLDFVTLAVLPAAVAGTVVGRMALRAVVHHRRRAGHGLTRVLAVGSAESVAALVERTRRAPEHGWRVVGACTPVAGGEVAGVPVIGDLDAVGDQVLRSGAEIVAVTPAPGWSSRRLHRLAWELEGTDLDLVVDPGLMEIAGPRLHMTPVDGLPMIRLTPPTFSGVGRLTKAVTDRVLAALAVLALSPVLLGVALAIRLDDGGPVLFRQERVGRDGRRFAMLKFRSMVVEADRARARLAAADEGAGPLFKLRRDPRITRVGVALRRWSLDELPQLFNVLGGSMSLVGPRPPLPAEVTQYGVAARRRLLVRPGMTGLWQVSGRSDLSWEETVRLDLRYVENWSPGLDIHILARTVTAVFTGRGAY